MKVLMLNKVFQKSKTIPNLKKEELSDYRMLDLKNTMILLCTGIIIVFYRRFPRPVSVMHTA
jgi:hypothetical protein